MCVCMYVGPFPSHIPTLFAFLLFLLLYATRTENMKMCVCVYVCMCVCVYVCMCVCVCVCVCLYKNISVSREGGKRGGNMHTDEWTTSHRVRPEWDQGVSEQKQHRGRP